MGGGEVCRGWNVALTHSDAFDSVSEFPAVSFRLVADDPRPFVASVTLEVRTPSSLSRLLGFITDDLSSTGSGVALMVRREFCWGGAALEAIDELSDSVSGFSIKFFCFQADALLRRVEPVSLPPLSLLTWPLPPALPDEPWFFSDRLLSTRFGEILALQGGLLIRRGIRRSGRTGDW